MTAPVTTADMEISIVSLGDTDRLTHRVNTLAEACEGLVWRLTIVDNSRAGADLAAASAAAPSTSVIRSEGRRGFGTNHNSCSVTCLPWGARATCSCSTTTPNSTGARSQRLSSTPTVMAVSAPWARRSATPTGRRQPSQLPWPTVSQQVLQTAFPRRQAGPAPRGWLNGACLLPRTSALRQVGLFDTTFFLFFEDTDLCLRLANAGWRVDTCMEASIIHHGHQTILAPELRPDIEEQVLRSRHLFFHKHHSPAAARAVTILVRGTLLIRVAKMLAESVVGRGATGFSQPRTLWALIRSRPRRPSRLELKAGTAASSDADATSMTCRSGSHASGDVG